MRKSILTFSSAALLLGGLTACGVGDRAADNRYYENTRPIGYYTSENNPYVNNDRTRNVSEQRGNAYRIEDNDGPLNEILDRAVIYGERNNRTRTNISPAPTRTRTNISPAPTRTRTNTSLAPTRMRSNERMFGLGQRDVRFSRSDTNYHGQLNGLERTANPSYYNNYKGRLTEQLAERASNVEGVEDARAVVYGDDIMIAVEPEEGANNQRVKRGVRQAAEPLVENNDLRVVVDEGMYSRVRTVDNDLRNGNPLERLNQDIRNLFD